MQKERSQDAIFNKRTNNKIYLFDFQDYFFLEMLLYKKNVVKKIKSQITICMIFFALQFYS